MENYTDINSSLQELLSVYLVDMKGFFVYARIIAGIGLIVSTYFTFFQIMGGSDESIKKFLTKFLAVFLGIAYYPTLLLMINYPLDIITDGAKKLTEKDIVRLDQVRSNRDDKAYDISRFEANSEYEAEYKKLFPVEAQSAANNEASFLESMANGVVNKLTDGMVGVIVYLFEIIAELSLIILNIIRGFFLIVLSIFGVFVIALSSFPTLEGSFSQWLTKYINVYLWLAIGYILQSVLIKVKLLETMRDNVANDSMITADSSFFGMLISLCTIIGFLAVPTLSGWMVTAATNSAGSKMAQSGKEVAKQVTTAVATGGVV